MLHYKLGEASGPDLHGLSGTDAIMITTEKEIPSKRAGSAILKRNVLIIEDDVDTAEVLAMTLRDEGYGVRYVCSRDEALIALSQFIYDIIIMDLSMPGLSADQFIEFTKRRSPRSKFILTTAAGQVAESALKLGIPRWIGKPFAPDALIDLLSHSV
jgi:two-component system response regulator FlrC